MDLSILTVFCGVVSYYAHSSHYVTRRRFAALYRFLHPSLGMKLCEPPTIRNTNTPWPSGYGNNPEHAELELTYNYGVTSYEIGTAYGHIAIAVPDAAAACAAVKGTWR